MASPAPKKEKTLSKCEVNQTHTHHPFFVSPGKRCANNKGQSSPPSNGKSKSKVVQKEAKSNKDICTRLSGAQGEKDVGEGVSLKKLL